MVGHEEEREIGVTEDHCSGEQKVTEVNSQRAQRSVKVQTPNNQSLKPKTVLTKLHM